MDSSLVVRPEVTLIAAENMGQAYSDRDGFLSIFVKILTLSLFNDSFGVGFIKVNIDGVIAYSTLVQLFPTGWYQQSCFHLKLIHGPDTKNLSEYLQIAGQVFTTTIMVQAIDNLGEPVSDLSLTLTPLTNSYLTISRQPKMENFMNIDSETIEKFIIKTNASGFAEFSDIKVNNICIYSRYYMHFLEHISLMLLEKLK